MTRFSLFAQKREQFVARVIRLYRPFHNFSFLFENRKGKKRSFVGYRTLHFLYFIGFSRIHLVDNDIAQIYASLLSSRSRVDDTIRLGTIFRNFIRTPPNII